MREAILEKVKECLSKFSEVDIGYVFGSFLRGKFTDVDVAVLLSETPRPHDSVKIAMRVAQALEEVFEFKFVFDVKVLNSSPIYFQYEVIRDGEPIFYRDEATRISYEAMVLSEYLDYKDVLDWFDEKLLARA